MSRNHISIIVLVVIGAQLFVHAAGWIFVMRNKVEKYWPGPYTREATCISEDDGDALMWNTNLHWVYKSYADYEKMIEGFKDPTSAKDPNCPLRKWDECTNKWTATSKDWQFASSVEKPMGPVFDNRWEAFKEYSFDMKKFLYLNEVKSWNTLVFSIRAYKDAVFSFKMDLNESKTYWYRIIIGGGENTKSSISQCENESLGNSCKYLTANGTENILSPEEWRTFILKVSQSSKEIQIYDTNKLVMSTSVHHEISKNVAILKARSFTSGFLKFHQYDYLYTEKSGKSLISPPWSNVSPNLCIQITIGICKDCTMKLFLVDYKKQEYFMKTMQGSDVSTVAELPAWRRVKIKGSFPTGLSNPVKLKILTEHTQDHQDGLWAVAMFRECSTTDNIRRSTIQLAKDYDEKHFWPSTTCQKLSYDKSTLIDVSLQITNTLSANSTLCLPGKLGPQCTVTCPGNTCQYISTCDESGCRCAQGYKGNNCDQPCEYGTYGHNCKDTCGFCKDGANCNHITGDCFNGCNNNDHFHLEPKCKIVFNPPMKPELNKLNYTYVRIKVPINPEYRMVDYRRIGIHILDQDSKYIEFNDAAEQVEAEFSLQHGTTYQIQIIAYLTTYNYAIKGTITNFTTPCIENSNIEVETTETSVIVSVPLKDEFSCPLYWYNVTLENNQKRNPTNASTSNGKLGYAFYNLPPYTEYRLLVKHEQDIYYNQTLQTLQDAPTAVQHLTIRDVSQDTVQISWDPPATQNGILKEYNVTTERLQLSGCEDYNRESQPWKNVTILNPNSKWLNLPGLHPYSKYLVQVVAKTVKPGPSVQTQFNTPASKIPTSIVSRLTINNLNISWEPPEDCSTITGPTSKVAVVVQGYSENVVSFKIRKQTAHNSIDITKEDLPGAEDYTARVYIIRNYNDTLEDTPYLNLSFKTNAKAPPKVTRAEIVEINTEKNTVIVRWGQPAPPTNGKIISYSIYLKGRQRELIKNASAEEPCDLWPELICATISVNTRRATQIGICANNEGIESCGKLVELWIPSNWNSILPDPPRGIEANSQDYGEVLLTWTHPWKTYNHVDKFRITIEALSTDLAKDWTTSDHFTEIEHPIVNYKREYSRTLYLSPSTSYNISVKAITINDVTGSLNFTKVTTKWSANFTEKELNHTVNDADATITIKVPDIVNCTRDSLTYVLVKSQESCKAQSLFPEYLKRHVTVDSYEATWLAAILQSHDCRGKIFKVGDNKTYGGELNCVLRPQASYEIIIIAGSNIEQSVSKAITIRSSQINIGEVPTPISKSWLILIPLLAIVIVIIYRYRQKVKAVFQNQDGMPLTEKLTGVNHENHSIELPKVEKPSPTFSSRNSEPSSLATPPVVSRRNHPSPESEYTSMVKVKNFEDYVREAVATGLLDKQYEMFPRGQTKPWTYGEQEQNKPKNRYKNLLAYDETRVILEKLPDDPYSDYINANYIQGFNKERAYIATQGPKQNTVNDFWRMVWQEKSFVICMVANIMENGKAKCEQYWPDIGKKRQFGDFLVSNIRHNVLADYTFRTFHVTYDNETRKIEHLHYTSWPDHGVPLYTHGIVAFLRKLLATSPGPGPIVTHCSAGVGRTGTIILCHICLHRAAAEGVVDVLAETKKIRSQRANMVDNKQQYLMAHLVIAECLLALNTEIPCNDTFSQRIKEMKQQLRIQQQRLETIAWQDEALQPTSLQNPLPFQNWPKTRYPEEAKGNCKRVYLTRYPPSDADSDYIAAVYVDGVKLQNQYVAAQLPLPSTVSDFWRMIAEFQIELIVQLQPADPEDPTCCEILPDDGNIDPTPYLNVSTHEIIDSEYFTTRKLLLTNKSKDTKREQQVTILSCKSWKPGRHQELPLPVALVSLWQAAERIPRGDGPMVSLCHDGVTGCGLYLALCFLLERMAVERECDVLLAIRAVRRSRREFVQTIEQFGFLYDAALTFTEYFETYSNFS